MTLVLEQDTAPVTENARFAVLAPGAVLQRGLGEELSSRFDGAEIVETSEFSVLIRALNDCTAGDLATVDLVVVDLATPGLGGLVGLLYLRSQFPGMPFLTLTASGDAGEMRRCVEAGAAGFVSTTASMSRLAEAIGAVLDGEIPERILDHAPSQTCGRASAWTGEPTTGADTGALHRLRSLTPQQMRVLTLLCGGLLNKQIAYELRVSEATVKAHVSAVLQKLGVDGRFAAVGFVAAVNGGLVA